MDKPVVGARSNRARLPTADQAIHASDGSSQGSTCQRAASFYLFALSLVSVSFRCYTGHPRARASLRMRSAAGGGRHRVVEWRLTRAGRAQLKPRTQATTATVPVGRQWTPIGSRQRIGDPLHVDLTERAADRSGYPCIQQQQPKQHASASHCPRLLALALVRVVFRSAMGLLKHRFAIRVIVPTTSGRRPAVCSVVGARRRTHPASGERWGRPYQCIPHIRGASDRLLGKGKKGERGISIERGRLGGGGGKRGKAGWPEVRPVSPAGGARPMDVSPLTRLPDHVKLEDLLKRQVHKIIIKIMRSNKINSLGIEPKRPASDPAQRALGVLRARTRQNDEGRYETVLLWRNNEVRLQNNDEAALSRLIKLEKRLDQNETLKMANEAQMVHTIKSGYAEIAADPPCEGRTWYLPHFAVGTSLNEKLLAGPDLLQSLPAVLMKFRQHRLAVTADIKEMFLQVGITKEDRDALRLLW
ncbi:hypothetical protein EVAR_96626_1 [Eumeta japonica]|uniref:Uncharacterized protein n=1 Tax=Eumeta variegata TaxID=151549 RepID=A0A4C1WRD0_EUMVA|nr:hypothetical protein EVAR_96626_1 [Eumeta japonica]